MAVVRPWLFVALLLASACRERQAQEPRPGPPLVAKLSPIADLAVAARLEVTAPGATEIAVHYGSDPEHLSETRVVPVPATGTVETSLIGLPPDATTHARIEASYPGRGKRSSDLLTVRSAAAPAGLPTDLHVTTNEATASDVLLLSLNGKSGQGSFAVAVDRRGRVLWYRRCPKIATVFDRLPNGRLITYDAKLREFLELELDGTVSAHWKNPDSIGGADSHDFQLLPSGNAMVLGFETHRVDSRGHFAEGAKRALRFDATVSEVGRDGQLIWRWSSWTRVSEDELVHDPKDPIDTADYEITHANSIDPLPDGNLLVSFRDMSSVVKISRQTNQILFRFGGKRSDFRIEGDPLGGFARQHDARSIGAGHILLFDNGNFHEPPESRAVEYVLDENTRIARFVWEFRHTPPLFAPMGGSARRLANGHTLIAWAVAGVVTEVDAGGRTVWEAGREGFGVHAARTAPSLH